MTLHDEIAVAPSGGPPTMRAVVLDHFGDAGELRIAEVP
jgi:hypothetical protein